ncbi:MAG: STAS domain-containing protein [Bacteroidota bacterium]
MIFNYTTSKKNEISIYTLQGELIDREQPAAMLAEIESGISNNSAKILLNMADLKYINSSGLNVIINILTKARKAGGDVAICCVSKKVNDLLVITKLNSVFNVCTDEAKALEVLSN